MSKVQNADNFDRHIREKCRHSLRRKETEDKKKSRFRAVRNGEYAYACGYRIKDERFKKTPIYKVIPAHTESVKKITGYATHPYYWYDRDGYAHRDPRMDYDIPIYTYKTVMVPEKTIVKHTWEYLPIKPYLWRYDIRKKYFKRISERKVRRRIALNEEDLRSNRVVLSNGGQYKTVHCTLADFLW